jgi:N6-L-threonylcarbamoyladenine synthase
MSFSGLKTAVLRARDRLIADQGGLTEGDRADICAGFQAAVADVLAAKTGLALEAQPDVTALAVAGGVAANATLRAGWTRWRGRRNCRFWRRRWRCAPTTRR